MNSPWRNLSNLSKNYLTYSTSLFLITKAPLVPDEGARGWGGWEGTRSLALHWEGGGKLSQNLIQHGNPIMNEGLCFPSPPTPQCCPVGLLIHAESITQQKHTCHQLLPPPIHPRAAEQDYFFSPGAASSAAIVQVLLSLVRKGRRHAHMWNRGAPSRNRWTRVPPVKTPTVWNENMVVSITT